MTQAPLFTPQSDMNIRLRVIGIPAPQGSKTAWTNPHTGRATMVEGKSGQRERHRTWREGVAQAARDWLAVNPRAPLDEPVGIQCAFYFPAPSADKYRTRHKVRPDLDKLLRSTWDALTFGGLIKDDSVICSVTAQKLYCNGVQPPGAEILLTPLGWVEARDREVLKAAARSRR